MTIGKTHAFGSHLIEVRCRYATGSVAAKISEAEIVGVYNYKIGFFHEVC